MTIRDAAGATDTGHKRRRNEDAYVCEPPLFAVADGMGGHQAGEVASRLAAAALREDVAPAGGPERVEALIREANRRIWQHSLEDVSASGMGTTVTVALVEGDLVTIGHVGDSRAYRVRDRQIEQLTDDHSLAAELERSGKLSAAGGAGPPAALGDHPRARHRARGRDRHVHRRGPPGRPVPALLRRALLDGRRRGDPGGARGPARQASTAPRASSSAPPTEAAAMTTSRSSASSSGRTARSRRPQAPPRPTRTRSTAACRSRSRLRRSPIEPRPGG